MSENLSSPSPSATAGDAPLSASVPPFTPSGRNLLENLRNHLAAERGQSSPERRRAIDALDREIQEMEGEANGSSFDRRRRGLESQIREHETHNFEVNPESIHNPSFMRARRRAIRPSERIQRQRDRFNQTTVARQEIEPWRIPVSLPPVPRIGSPDIAAREYSGEAQVNRENRWRAKRRKLDSDENSWATRGFKYGHQGQVVPGKLKMQIVSCDGGQYTEPNGDSSGANNVLEDDSTVYCTHRNQCNMILGHLGNMPFSLSKIVIKAPQKGFDAPIQQGMVFIAMDDDDLLAGTSNYQIRYNPRDHDHPQRRPEQGQMRLAPSHEYFNSVRPPLQTIDRSALINAISQQSPGPVDTLGPDTTESDAVQMLSNTPPRAPEVPHVIPGFRLTVTYDAMSNEEDEVPRPATYSLLNPSLPGIDLFADNYTPFYLDHTSDENEVDNSSDPDTSGEEMLEILHRRNPDYQGMSAAEQRLMNQEYMREHRHWQRTRRRNVEDRWRNVTRDFNSSRRTASSRIEVGPAPDMGATSVDPQAVTSAPNSSRSTGPAGSKRLAPHAMFDISKGNSSVSIKFDPPVAGKFVLVKLWAPCPNLNIDIQSIIVQGFAGPRFFPAVEYR